MMKPVFAFCLFFLSCLQFNAAFAWFINPYQVVNPDLVTIVRDEWGVPHIFGKTDAEVAYGLAWASAEDNFEIMQQTLLATRGMLGRVLGKDGAIADFAVRLIKAREVVVEKMESDVSPHFRNYLEAFAQGINDYAAAHPKELLVKKIFPVYVEDILTGYVLSMSIMSGIDKPLRRILNGKIVDYIEKEGIGSNALAFNSKKTEDGSVMLAINSHQPLEGPLSWYEVHLHSEEGLNILGGVFPGGASVFHGANENLGWAHTVNQIDLVDTYQLSTDRKNKLSYRVDGQTHQLEEEKVKLKVKVGPINIPVRKKIHQSIYGPTLITKHGTFSIRFPSNMDIRAAEQWFWMNKAQNLEEFETVLKMQGHPKMNIIYADKEDNLLYVCNGLYPERDLNYNWKNVLPGDTSATLWTAFKPWEKVPKLLNPSCGYIYNMNNGPFQATCAEENLNPDDFDHTMGIHAPETNRSRRFRELIEQFPKVSYENFLYMKYDDKLPQCVDFPADINPLFSLDPAEFPDVADVITELNKWDRRTDVSSTGAGIGFLVVTHLVDKIRNLDLDIEEEITLGRTMIVDAVREAKKHLVKNFATINVPLGRLQLHVRGDKEIGVAGFPDVLRAMYSVPYKEGKYRTFAGESYIQLVQWKDGKMKMETVNSYGASNNPNSPHYNDQMELFVNKETKTMTLNKEEIFKNARHVYAPGKQSLYAKE